jgi:tetratricopeptide (TPR) repeat protein
MKNILTSEPKANKRYSMTHPTILRRRLRALMVFGLSALFVVPTMFAQGSLDGGSGLTPKQELELHYADRLLANGLPNYSTLVLDRMNLPPEIMNIRKVQGLGALGKFDEAEALVAAQGGDSQAAWTLKLTLADAYYAHGKYDKAQELYESFFNKFPNGPEKALQPFYMASAYKYAKMMLLTGNKKAAADAYRMALKAKPERHIERQLQSELCEVLIKMAEEAEGADREKLLKETKTLVDSILWVQDVWFGRAVVMMAHMRMMRGDVDGALSLVDDYRAELIGIDEVLKQQSTDQEDLTKLSPMAQCRYLIGKIMLDQAEKILTEGGDRQVAYQMLVGKGKGKDGAVQHFLNVFVRYPNTAWAADAGNRFRKVEALLLEQFGKEIKAKITPEQWAKVEAAQFREARTLFNQQQYANAAELYEQVLSLFPDRETAVQALGELASCYIETKDFMLADTVARHLAERFNQNKDLMALAGDKVIGIAFKYGELNMQDKWRETYDVFFKYFSHHPRTVVALLRFAAEAAENGNTEEALSYYQRIIDDHENKPAYLTALRQVAAIYEKQGDPRKQLITLSKLKKKLDADGQKSQLQIAVMYQIAAALKSMGPQYADKAAQQFNALEKLLRDEKARAAYQKNPDEAASNLKFLQASMLFGAMADATRKTVPENVKSALEKRAKRKLSDDWILKNFYKRKAVKKLEELVKMFPESETAPSALSQIGTLYTVIGDADEARKALQRLQKDYPQSPQAANAVFMIGLNLLDMGMRVEAIAYFKQMFSTDGDYTPAQILTAGRELFKAGEYEIAIEAFDQVIAAAKERKLLEPSRVQKGLAFVNMKRYEEAIKVLEPVLEEYPKSGFTIDICRGISEAYAAVASEASDEDVRYDLFNKAVETIKRARRFARDDGTKTELDVTVGKLFERKSTAERNFGTEEKADGYRADAVAAYQAVMMFKDPKDKEVAPHLQEAYGRCLPLMVEMERWDDVMQDGQKYLDAFPNGKYTLEARQALTKARIGGGAAETEETTEETPVAEAEPQPEQGE